MNHEATAKVMKKGGAPKHGPVHSVSFKKVKGGIISTTMHNSSDPERHDYGPSHSEEQVHKSMGSAKKHMDACFGGGDTPEEEAAEEAAGK